MKPKMIELYMDMCDRVAQMSVAERAKVGALIVKDNNILSFGWNGMPSGWTNECEYEVTDLESEFSDMRITKLKSKPEVLHAETNAIAKMARSAESCEGATLFCTHLPCLDCAKLIYQSGITEVYYDVEYDAARGNGKAFLQQSGVMVRSVNIPQF